MAANNQNFAPPPQARVSKSFLLGWSNQPYKYPKPEPPPAEPRRKQLFNAPGAMLEWAASDGRKGRLRGGPKVGLTHGPYTHSNQVAVNQMAAGGAPANAANVPVNAANVAAALAGKHGQRRAAPSVAQTEDLNAVDLTQWGLPANFGMQAGAGSPIQVAAANVPAISAPENDTFVHEYCNGCQEGWTREMNANLMERKNNGEIWTDIVTEMNNNYSMSKDKGDFQTQFSHIKPKDWRPANAQQGKGQKGQKGQKQKQGGKGGRSNQKEQEQEKPAETDNNNAGWGGGGGDMFGAAFGGGWDNPDNGGTGNDNNAGEGQWSALNDNNAPNGNETTAVNGWGNNNNEASNDWNNSNPTGQGKDKKDGAAESAGDNWGGNGGWGNTTGDTSGEKKDNSGGGTAEGNGWTNDGGQDWSNGGNTGADASNTQNNNGDGWGGGGGWPRNQSQKAASRVSSQKPSQSVKSHSQGKTPSQNNGWSGQANDNWGNTNDNNNATSWENSNNNNGGGSWNTSNNDTGNNGGGGWDNSNNNNNGGAWGPTPSAKGTSHKSHRSHKTTSQAASHRSSRSQATPGFNDLYPDSTFSMDDLKLISRILAKDHEQVWFRLSCAFQDKTNRRIHPDVLKQKILGNMGNGKV